MYAKKIPIPPRLGTIRRCSFLSLSGTSNNLLRADIIIIWGIETSAIIRELINVNKYNRCGGRGIMLVKTLIIGKVKL